jgi:tetratricopeptide (TPR) repeat protein
VAARAVTQPSLSLAALAEELRDSGRLNALSTGETTTDVRAVLSWSYRALTPDAARLFRLLGLHPGPDISAPAAASLAGLPPPRVRPLLAELTRTHLVVERPSGRYTCHDLLREYASQLAGDEPADERDGALLRVLDHYLQTAHVAVRLLEPARHPVSPGPLRPGVTPEDLDSYEQALAWFTTEHPVLVVAVGHAARTGRDSQTWQLARALVTFLDQGGHWRDWVDTQEAALRAARRLGDRAGQAYSHRSLGLVNALLSRYDDAQPHLRDALDLYHGLGDSTGQARSHLNLASLYAPQGHADRALSHTQQALDLFQAVGDRAGEAIATSNVGWYHAMLGEYQPAITWCERALALLRQLGNRHGEACVWDSLGYAQHHLGQPEEAVTCYGRALDLYRREGDRYHEADTLTHLGDTHQATGDRAAAQRAFEAAAAILDDLDHPDAGPVRAKVRALVSAPTFR